MAKFYRRISASHRPVLWPALVFLAAWILVATAQSAWAATPTAQYEVTFDASWSPQTHPDDFPPDPHFSPVVGGTLMALLGFWRIRRASV